MTLPKDYYNFFDVCRMEGINENTAKSATGKGLESIATMEALKPIGHLFKEFEKPVKGGMRKQYGIKRTHYDYWKKHGHAPKLSPGRPPKVGQVELKIYLPKDIRNEFYAIVDKAKSMSLTPITYTSMAAVAIKEFNDRRRHILDGDD